MINKFHTIKPQKIFIDLYQINVKAFNFDIHQILFLFLEIRNILSLAKNIFYIGR